METPCYPTPCLNGGNCKVDGDNTKCDCQAGFEGDHCENSTPIH